MNTTTTYRPEETAEQTACSGAGSPVQSLNNFLTEYFRRGIESLVCHVNAKSYLVEFYRHLGEDCPAMKCLFVHSDRFEAHLDKFGCLDKCLAFRIAELDLVVSMVFAGQDSACRFESGLDHFQSVFKTLLFNLIKFEFHNKTSQTATIAELERLYQMTEKHRNFVEIARGIMHSFNNHLALIMGRTQLLSMFSGEVIEKKAAQKGLDIILKATNAASDQVSILQSYARMDPDEKPNQVPVGELIDEIMNLSMPRWKGMGHGAISFEYQIDPNLSFVGNRRKIKEVLINILMNSVEAEAEKGGVIEITAEQKDSEIIISINDKGAGMPAADLKKVCEPLYSTKNNGSGLGLYLARKFVEQEQGKLELESEIGKGTTVKIYLPIN